jgi:hypothetical protein
MIEHLSKWLELVPLLNYSSEGVAYAFMDKMFSCHNPSLGLVTKAKACKGAGQKGSPGVTSHAFGSAKECEGMNLYIPKELPL